MPTYGYECKSCGHTFDVFQSMKDEPIKTCPECGKAVRRLINGGTGIIFKGNGFYVTDKSGNNGKPKDRSAQEQGTQDNKTAGDNSKPDAGKSAACQSCPKPSAGSQDAGQTCPKAANS